MHFLLCALVTLSLCPSLKAQIPVDLSKFDKKSGVSAVVRGTLLEVEWPTGDNQVGKVAFDLRKAQPLISSLQIGSKREYKTIARDLDPAVILSVGKRDLISQNGWNIFFDKTAYLPHESFVVTMDKTGVKVVTTGAQTEIIVSRSVGGAI